MAPRLYANSAIDRHAQGFTSREGLPCADALALRSFSGRRDSRKNDRGKQMTATSSATTSFEFSARCQRRETAKQGALYSPWSLTDQPLKEARKARADPRLVPLEKSITSNSQSTLGRQYRHESVSRLLHPAHKALFSTNSRQRDAPLASASLPQPLPLRCTILDAKGSVKVVSGSFSRASLCAQHKLEARDLRKVDSRVPNVVPTILVRGEAFLVNILHIRALVKKDQVLLFDSYGSTDTALHSAFIYALQHNLSLQPPHSTLPYEFRALESILSSVLSALSSELGVLRNLITDLLEALEEDIDREKLLSLLLYTRKLRAFLARCRGSERCIMDVLEEDEDMEAMYLTHSRRNTGEHLELQLLLESFDHQLEELIAQSEAMSSNIDGTREIIDLILDNNRNQLLTLDLRTSIGMLGISVGTLWAGLFGMNLMSGYEEHPFAFYATSSVAFISAVVVGSFGNRVLNKTRRVGLAMRTRPSVGKSLLPGWLPGVASSRSAAAMRREEAWMEALSSHSNHAISPSDALEGHGYGGSSTLNNSAAQHGPLPTAAQSSYTSSGASLSSSSAPDAVPTDSAGPNPFGTPVLSPPSFPSSDHTRTGPLYDAASSSSFSRKAGKTAKKADKTALGGPRSGTNALDTKSEEPLKPWRPFTKGNE
ncbi:cora-domain-containing protein [Ceraceosorus bombacis]|uniref:Cora-domain-containing protein n=1 Tax=Ceraceosorus bombacis TaxID=401625 RepID=A0A0P1BNW7_9BASI|nr:cora-domain-containing protein [Ceraceosorus bombacis]